MPRYPEIVPRDDGMYDVISGDTTAGPFPTIAFALRIASGHQPAPAPTTKFRRVQIREVRLDAPPDSGMQNPRQDDRHHLTGVKQRRFIEALNNRDDSKNLQIVKTNSDDAPETALGAALLEALRRKARAS